MKFSVTQGQGAGGRIGTLTLTKTGISGSSETLETPLSLAYTRGGFVPHLAPDVLRRLEWPAPTLLQVPLASQAPLLDVLEKFGAGYRAFAGLQGHVYSCNQDPMAETRSGYNDKRGIAVWTRGGRTQLDAAKFMRLQAAVRPDLLQLLCDADTPADASSKRQRKALDRSLQLLDQCLALWADTECLSETAVLAPLVGGHVTGDRLRSARAAADRAVHGYTLEGLAAGPDTQLLPSVEHIEQLVRDTLAVLPAGRPRLLHGPWRPLHVLRLLQLGVDLFDSSYPCLVTERAAALVFPLSVSAAADRRPSGDVSNGRVGEAEDRSPLWAPVSGYEISLKDQCHADADRPLVAGCTCYTCTRHSRAYVHHLLSVGELLASVLLTLHNLHHWAGMFAAARAALADDSLHRLISTYEQLEQEVRRRGGV